MCALSPIVACRYALIETRWCCDTVQKYQTVVAFSPIAVYRLALGCMGTALRRRVVSLRGGCTQ
ncbi:hypothetical protein BRN42_01760, partial [Xanthomonas oryzae pv. oryzae]